MGLIAVSMDDRDMYVSRFDPARKVVKTMNPETNEQIGEEIEIDNESATIFELTALDVRTFARINDMMMKLSQVSGVSMQMNEANVEIVRHGLKGWRNFQDKDGSNALFLTEKVPQGSRTLVLPTDQTLSMLGKDLLKELAERIKELTQVSVQAVKN